MGKTCHFDFIEASITNKRKMTTSRYFLIQHVDLQRDSTQWAVMNSPYTKAFPGSRQLNMVQFHDVVSVC